MFDAPSRVRGAAALGDCPNFSESARKNGTVPIQLAGVLACALAVLFAPVSSAQTINLSLNVFASNHTWELVAKSSPSPGSYGIAGVTVKLTDIANVLPQIEGPRGTVNVTNAAGFQLFDNPQPSFHEFTVAQVPISPLPFGKEQDLFFGVGTLINGSPDYPGKPPGSNFIGPTFTSLTNPQDIPWAATGDVLGDSAWDRAARLASGTFAVGVTPAFAAASIGNVFTSLNVNNFGDQVQATTVTSIVRTIQGADYNHNGIVDAGDYVVWRKTLNASVVPAGSGADGNGDGTVNLPDYTLWRSHFGSPFGAGAGGSLSTNAVPEPASCLLLTIGALLAIAPRRVRSGRMVNN